MTTQDVQENNSLFAEMRRLSPKITGGIMRSRQAAYEDGKVPGKYKGLLLAPLTMSHRRTLPIR